MTKEIKPPFTNLQMELLKLFSLQLSDEELTEIRKLLTCHLMDKAREQATRIGEERGYNEDTFKNWATGND